MAVEYLEQQDIVEETPQIDKSEISDQDFGT